MKHRLLLLGCLGTVLAISPSSFADTITWTGTGVMLAPEANLSAYVHEGDAIRFVVSYDSSALPSQQPPNETFYGAGAAVNIRFTIGSQIWQGTQLAAPGIRTAIVQNNIFNQADNLVFVLQQGFPPDNATLSGPGVNQLFISFHSRSQDLLSSSSLPVVSQVNLPGLTSFGGWLATGYTRSRFIGDVSSVTVVPEPEIAALLIGACSGLTLQRLRSRSRQTVDAFPLE